MEPVQHVWQVIVYNASRFNPAGFATTPFQPFSLSRILISNTLTEYKTKVWDFVSLRMVQETKVLTKKKKLSYIQTSPQQQEKIIVIIF